MRHSNNGLTFPPEPLTAEEAQRLIRACSRRSSCGVRNAALFTVLYRGGLRIGEALALLPKDVDTVNGTIRILRGKGDKSRMVGIDDGAVAVLARWLDRRKVLGLTGHNPLFCTLRGTLLSHVYVRGAMKRAGQRAGIEKRVHPHGLRHTHASELMAEGVPVNVIQQVLGHASLATTDVYLRHVAPAEVVRVMREREWNVA